MASHTLAAAKSASSKWMLQRNTTASTLLIRRSVATTQATKVVQATNMPLSQLFSGEHNSHHSSSPTGSNSSTRQHPQQLQARQQMSVLAAVTPEEQEMILSSSLAARKDLSNSNSNSKSESSNNNDSSSSNLPQNLDEVDMEELERLANLTPTPLRLGAMFKYGGGSDLDQRLKNAQFLHHELQIRLAQRAYDLLSLPYGLSKESGPVREVALIYIQYLHQFKEMPSPKTHEEENAFTELLHSMVLDRTTIPVAIARGLAEWLNDERREDLELERQQEMEDALVRFFTARVGLRFLTEHHILSSPNPKLKKIVQETQSSLGTNGRSEMRGCIQADCDPVLECEKVAEEVARQTYDLYGMCPEIEIVDREAKEANPFTYVPHHLHYMLSELLKNSCRASVER